MIEAEIQEDINWLLANSDKTLASKYHDAGSCWRLIDALREELRRRCCKTRVGPTLAQVTEAQAAASSFAWSYTREPGGRKVASTLHRGRYWCIVQLFDGGFWPGESQLPDWVPSVPAFDTLRDAERWCEFVGLADGVLANGCE